MARCMLVHCISPDKTMTEELIKAVMEERELDIVSDEEHLDIGNTGVAEDTDTDKPLPANLDSHASAVVSQHSV